ncbi:hypothetical protein VTJ04DRAFT_6415 [Mycothermus thermophilus]|uniref:uncharacterized protein n=1 Tax=Humicola insolens TaxID=85995 RepID=UPI003743E870
MRTASYGAFGGLVFPLFISFIRFLGYPLIFLIMPFVVFISHVHIRICSFLSPLYVTISTLGVSGRKGFRGGLDEDHEQKHIMYSSNRKNAQNNLHQRNSLNYQRDSSQRLGQLTLGPCDPGTLGPLHNSRPVRSSQSAGAGELNGMHALFHRPREEM